MHGAPLQARRSGPLVHRFVRFVLRALAGRVCCSCFRCNLLDATLVNGAGVRLGRGGQLAFDGVADVSRRVGTPDVGRVEGGLTRGLGSGLGSGLVCGLGGSDVAPCMMQRILVLRGRNPRTKLGALAALRFGGTRAGRVDGVGILRAACAWLGWSYEPTHAGCIIPLA